MIKHLIINSLEQMDEITKEILLFCGDVRIILFFGEMGAGKTTMIKSFCKILGYTQETQSPTFSIINEYHTQHHVIYHMDLYRLESLDQLIDIGFEEYIYSGGYCFIEWPQISVELISDPYCKLIISVDDMGNRKIAVEIIN
jgi:tRNA threonylcarbamoyladenosine biosynthesis protein TsaE